jgi:ABC-2 type transport system permease protein
MRVGSLPWLLRHELLLWWREISSRPGVIILMIGFGLLIPLPFVLLWLGLRSTGLQLSLTDIPGAALWFAGVIWLAGFFYAFIRAMARSITALFDRGDLDLLVASPVSSKVVFASRLLSVALEVFLTFCPFVIPVSLLAIALGIPQLLGIYPTLLGICLLAASLAMLLTLWLVRRLGARRARTVAQILTALISALIFLSAQLPNLLLTTNRIPEQTWVDLQVWLGEESFLAADSPIWFPARAIFFDPGAVLLTLIVSGGLVWVAVETLHHSFITGTQQSVTRQHRQRHAMPENPFSEGLNRILLLKEWRIIVRNPYLVSAIFLQILFMIPAMIIVLQGNFGKAIAGFAPFVTMITIFIGESLTMSLTRICVSGEEAPDLLKSSPVSSPILRRQKLLASVIPVWLLLSPFFMILLIKGEPWLMPLLVFLSATTCAAVLRLWNSRPIPLADIFKRRQNQSGDILLGLLEAISLFTWVWLGVGLVQGSGIGTFLPAGILLVVMAIAYWRSCALGTSLGF